MSWRDEMTGDWRIREKSRANLQARGFWRGRRGRRARQLIRRLNWPRRAHARHVGPQSHLLQAERIEFAGWRKPIRGLKTAQRLLRSAVPPAIRTARIVSAARERGLNLLGPITAGRPRQRHTMAVIPSPPVNDAAPVMYDAPAHWGLLIGRVAQTGPALRPARVSMDHHATNVGAVHRMRMQGTPRGLVRRAMRRRARVQRRSAQSQRQRDSSCTEHHQFSPSLQPSL